MSAHLHTLGNEVAFRGVSEIGKTLVHPHFCFVPRCFGLFYVFVVLGLEIGVFRICSGSVFGGSGSWGWGSGFV